MMLSATVGLDLIRAPVLNSQTRLPFCLGYENPWRCWQTKNIKKHIKNQKHEHQKWHGTIWNHETTKWTQWTNQCKKSRNSSSLRRDMEPRSWATAKKLPASVPKCTWETLRRVSEFLQKSKDAEKFSITHLKHLYDSYMRVVLKRKVKKLKASPLSTTTS